MPSLVVIGPSGSGEEDENVKSLQTDGQMDGLQTTGYQKSSIELAAQVNLKKMLIKSVAAEINLNCCI